VIYQISMLLCYREIAWSILYFLRKLQCGLCLYLNLLMLQNTAGVWQATESCPARHSSPSTRPRLSTSRVTATWPAPHPPPPPTLTPVTHSHTALVLNSTTKDWTASSASVCTRVWTGMWASCRQDGPDTLTHCRTCTTPRRHGNRASRRHSHLSSSSNTKAISSSNIQGTENTLKTYIETQHHQIIKFK